MESDKVEMKWYVLQAFSGFENKVKQTLEDTIKREGLEKSFGEILVPTEEVLEIKEGQKKRTERKYFPGYVMIKMDLNDHTWHMVKNSPKVLGFVGGTGDKPIPLGQNEASFCPNGIGLSPVPPTNPKTLGEFLTICQV